MIQIVKDYFSPLRALEISEFLLLTLTICSLPFSYIIAIWFLAGLIINGIAKKIIYKEAADILPKKTKIFLYLMVLFWGLYFVSIGYSDNSAMAWENIFHKLSFLLIPLLFLITSHNYLNAKFLRGLFYAFIVACDVLFLIYVFSSFWKIITDSEVHINHLFAHHKIIKHHTYYAMYLNLALVFIYHELFTRWKEILPWVRKGLIASAMALVLLVVFILSRTGILCLGLLVIWAFYDIIALQKRKRLGLIALGITLLIAIGAYFGMDKKYRRLTQTVVSTFTEEKKDVRFEIAQNAIDVIKCHWAFGVGIGDRIDVLNANREEKVGIDDEHKWHDYNPHNQFLDTWVAIGIPGLLTLLGFLVLPFIMAVHKGPKNVLLIGLLFIVILSCCFESIFERQMGILFFTIFFCLLQLPSTAKD